MGGEWIPKTLKLTTWVRGKENTCLAENFARKVDRSFREQEIWPLFFHSKPLLMRPMSSSPSTIFSIMLGTKKCV